MKFPAHSPYAIRSLIEQRLSEERLLIPRRSEAELSVPLCYPSPYHVAMSSLGYQVVYRLLNDPEYPRLRAERAFLPDDVEAWRRARLPLVTYESQTAVGLSPVILSVMGLGVPLIVSDIEENIYAVQDTAITFRKADPGSLAEKISYAEQHHGHMKELAAKARERALKEFNWDNVAMQHELIFSGVKQER